MNAETDAGALLEYMNERAAVELVHLATPGGRKMDVLVHHKDQSVTDLTDKLLALEPRPLRSTGTATLNSAASFSDWVNRQKNESTAIFAHNGPQPRMTAVINYANGAKPEWGDYRAQYDLALSPEWQTWMKVNEKPMSQEAFGQFLEDNLAEIAAPPSGVDDSVEYQLIQKLTGGGNAATAMQLLGVARSLVVNENSRLKSVINAHSGEVQMVYEAQHTGETGGTVDVPRLFVVCIPVFDGDAAYRIPVRLKYRKAEGGTKVVFFPSIYQPERYLRDAWGHLMADIAQRTGVPVFEGQAEAGGALGRVKVAGS